MRRQVIELVFLLLVCSATGLAQSGRDASSPDEEKGFTSVVQFGGSVNSSGRVFKLDSAIGYNFNERVGVDAGVPVYFVHASSATGASSSNNGIGNPYLDFRLTLRGAVVSYRAVVTTYLPLADKKSGFNAGRVTADWSNRLELSTGRLTPFVEAGIGNTIRDSRLFDRPFTSLGFNAHVEGGASVGLTDQVQLGGSAYAIVPHGEQRMFSRLLKMDSGSTMQHGRVFDTTTETVGTADLARDHGFSAWLGASPNEFLDCELGYTRSVSYDLNTVSFTVGVNIGRLARRNHQ